MGKLTKDFYNAASPECDPFHRNSKPAVRFEVVNGFENIAGYYLFPDGMNASEYEDYINTKRYPESADTMLAEWGRLVALNPELSVVKFDASEYRQVYYAVMGAACLFNPIDIDFFVNFKSFTNQEFTAEATRSDPRHMALLSFVNAHYPDLRSICWVPAPSTLLEIKRQLDRKIDQSAGARFNPDAHHP
jgi:hypothetical protein